MRMYLPKCRCKFGSEYGLGAWYFAVGTNVVPSLYRVPAGRPKREISNVD